MHSSDTGPTCAATRAPRPRPVSSAGRSGSDIEPVNHPAAPTLASIRRIGHGACHGSFTRASHAANSRDTSQSDTSPHVARRPRRLPGPGPAQDARRRRGTSCSSPTAGRARPPPRSWSTSTSLGHGRARRPARTPPTSTSWPWASRSPSTPTAGASTGPGRSTSSRGSSTPTEWRRIEAGLTQRLQRAQPVHRRPLQRAAGRRRRRVPGRAAGRRRPTSGPSAAGVRPGVRRVGPHLRQRPRARRRRHASTCSRTTCGCRRASATCSRTGSCPSGCSPTCSPTRASNRSTTTPTSCSELLASLAPDGRGRSDRRRAHPGRLQLGLLRAQLPGPPDGRRRSSRAATCSSATDDVRLHAHGRRARSGSTSSTAGSTTCSSTPRCSDADSTLGVPGLMRAWRAGQRRHRQRARAPASPTTRSSTPGCPTSSATTWARSRSCPTCRRTAASTTDERRYVLDHLRELVVKPANESGGYGLVIGDRATDERAGRRGPRPSRPTRATGWPSRSSPLSTAPTLVRRAGRAPPRRPAAVHPHRAHQLRHPRRPDPGGAAEGLAGRELLAGRRQQGHVGRRVLTPPSRPVAEP